jgi:quercetin dioxygenase-like cupin family protein
MKKVIPVDVSKFIFNIADDYSVVESPTGNGPPKQLSGISVGIVTMEADPPHGGEVHHDGDEIIYVISGVLRIENDSNPGSDIRLGAGESCIIKKGEWHKVYVVEKAQLIYITPGPNNEYRTQ